MLQVSRGMGRRYRAEVHAVEEPPSGVAPETIAGVHVAGTPDHATEAEVDLENLPSPWLTQACAIPSTGFVRWETARGCIFACSFCQHREPGSRQRTRPLGQSCIEAELLAFAHQ